MTKQDSQSTLRIIERPNNWDKELNGYPFYENNRVDEAYVAWHFFDEENSTAYVIGDIGKEYFYCTWSNIDKSRIIFSSNQEFKDWLKKNRENKVFKDGNLFNVVRFLYF